MNVLKRDGRSVPFSKAKIVTAVLSAFQSTDGAINNYAIQKANNIADHIEQKCQLSNESLTVEEIQDLVENGLMSTKRKDVAKEYVRFRYKKEVVRDVKSTFFDAIGEKLEAKNVQNQNANVDEHSFGGRIGEASGVMTKQYALDNIVSTIAKNNHLNNEIYIHDLDSYAVGMHNCLSIPFDDLLANGFNTRQTDVRPANSVNTAFQLVAVIFQLQSLQQFGGVSATHLDWTMVPYVRKSFYKHFKNGIKYCQGGLCYEDIHAEKMHLNENIYDIIDSRLQENYSIDGEKNQAEEIAYKYAMDMTIKEVYQAVEGMYHNLNTLQSRSGNQLN